jgi:hypothetical protein
MKTKTADSKGRVALGKAFANRPVIVEQVSPIEIRIVRARVIPENEAWLWENETALGMVRRGLQQANKGEFVDNAPDLDLDDSLADELAD